LSVVRGLIGLHGGAIAFESGAGAGTTVTVSLPAEARTADAPAAPAPITTAVRHAPARVERLARRPLGLFDADPI
ncbi:ATP-binding protein, partial [Enterobacter hormaechei]